MERNAKYDILEIEKLLLDNFNLCKNAVLSFETSLEKIQSMSIAKVNIVLNYEGLASAQILKERFGTPYVYAFPIGINQTNNWLLNIAKAIGANFEISKTQQPRKLNQQVLIYTSYDKALSLKQYMSDMGCDILDVVCTHKIKKQDGIRYIKTEKEKIEIFKSAKNSIIFADDTFLKFADNSNVKIDLTQETTLFNLKNLSKMF